MVSFKNATAVITGGTRGIGRAIAFKLAEHGINLALNFRSNEENAIKTKQEIEQHYPIFVSLHKADIRDEASVKQMINEISEVHGERINILINNAGVLLASKIDDLKLEDFEKVIKTNVIGTFLVTKHLVPILKKNAPAHIINIASIAGQTGGSVGVAYAASKGAILSFTKSLARELAPVIQVNSIAPDAVDTDLLTPEQKKYMKELNLMKRLVDSVEVAEAVLFLLRTSTVTGQTISINGGRYMS